MNEINGVVAKLEKMLCVASVAMLFAGGLALNAPSLAAEQPLVFEDVTLVETQHGTLAKHQVVVISGDVIEHVGPRDAFEVPEDAVRIEASGQFLMPGLAEMHGHLPFSGPNDPDVTDLLFLYLANGVTLVRGLQGHPEQIRVREAIEAGQVLGPRLVLGSPAMGWGNTPSADVAPGLVESFAEAGFDMVKIGEGPSPEAYAALAEAARDHRLPLVGHVPDRVGLEGVMDAGQLTIDHLDNYIEELVPAAEREDIAPLWGVASVADRADLGRLDALVDLTVEHQLAQVPTMVLWETFFGGEPVAAIRANTPEVRFMPPDTVEGWERSLARLRETIGHPAGARQVVTLRRLAFQRLHQAGVPFLLGTDSPQLFSVPGFSIHREMALWVRLGMTPAEVIHAGTWAVAEHFGELETAGAVAPGKRADLILLDANPLEDVAAIATNRAGVMVGGQWLSRSDIESRLEAIASQWEIMDNRGS